VLTESSIAFDVARLAQEERRADRAHRLPPALADHADREEAAQGRRSGDRAGRHNAEHLDALAATSASTSTASTASCMHRVSPAGRARRQLPAHAVESVATAVHVSAYSLKAIAMACLPLFGADGGSIVGLDSTRRWRGRATTGWRREGRAGVDLPLPGPRPRPRGHPQQPDLGRADQDHGGEVDPRVRPVRRRVEPAGPIGWDLHDAEPAARGVIALLSDWFPKTTGEIITSTAACTRWVREFRRFAVASSRRGGGPRLVKLGPPPLFRPIHPSPGLVSGLR